MSDNGLVVETRLPFACKPGRLSSTQAHGSLLLLKVLNLLDSHEAESDRAQERLETRLDLLLHWLGMHLYGAEALPETQTVRLAADYVESPLVAGLATEDMVVSLYPGTGLAAPLQLQGRLVGNPDGRAILNFENEAFADAWTQWLFRLHRRAVHEARSRAG